MRRRRWIDSPVVFKVEADHFGSEVEGGVAGGAGGTLNGSCRGEAEGIHGFVAKDGGRCGEEVELRGGVVFEVAADLWLVEESRRPCAGCGGRGRGRSRRGTGICAGWISAGR